jgi:hypothetical protein
LFEKEKVTDSSLTLNINLDRPNPPKNISNKNFKIDIASMPKSQSQNFQHKRSGLGERTLEGVAGGKFFGMGVGKGQKKNNFGIESALGSGEFGVRVDRRDEA